MCLIFFSLNQHPTYKLIVAANRDEFYERRTAPADYWTDHPDLLAGRDLEAQGTWLGMTTTGKLSLLTNYRDPKNIDPRAPSRGKLVSDFLTGNEFPDAYLSTLEPHAHRYNGFNLIVGNTNELWYLSNYANGRKKLTAGFFGLSNHLLDSAWPKVERGKDKLKPLFEKSLLQPEELFEVMYDDKRAADEKLPDTGIGLERERALSSMFIKTNNYGSRCTTVILVDKNNHALFAERVYNLTTFEHNTRTFEFKINE